MYLIACTTRYSLWTHFCLPVSQSFKIVHWVTSELSEWFLRLPGPLIHHLCSNFITDEGTVDVARSCQNPKLSWYCPTTISLHSSSSKTLIWTTITFFSKQKVRFSAQYHSFPQSSKTTKLDIIIKCCHRSNHLTVAQLQSYWLIDRSSFAASKGGREWGGVVRLWWRRRCYNDDQQVLGDGSVAFSMRITALNSHQGPLKL